MNFGFTGERFSAVYRLTGEEAEARAQAQDICLEQTVELPAALVTQAYIREHVLGRVEEFTSLAENVYQARISFAVEIVAGELTQLLNVVFGNISLKPGIRLERIDLPPTMLEQFPGPRFGRAGLRERLKIPERPLLCTALKPMGLLARDLAALAYQFARGGIDIIKDDHGLSQQHTAEFGERVERCVEAVARANQETGGNCIYAPNITAPSGYEYGSAMHAKRVGAGAVLVSPGIAGLSLMQNLAANPDFDLPILSHPSFQGSFVVSRDSGISHFCLFGQLNRLAGADAAIFPNFGGRFSFSRDDCRAIVEGCSQGMQNIAPIFPAPAGGMSLERVPEMREMYGRDVILLIGAGLRSHSPDLVANCIYFRELAEKI